MADIAENLRTVISGSTAVLAVIPSAAAPHGVEQGIEPESPDLPRVWFGRSGASEELDLDGVGGLVNQNFDVEIISDDLDEAQDCAAVVKRLLHGKRGTFGTQTVNGVFVEDHSDDYIPRGIGDDTGLNVAALAVSIWHEST